MYMCNLVLNAVLFIFYFILVYINEQYAVTYIYMYMYCICIPQDGSVNWTSVFFGDNYLVPVHWAQITICTIKPLI